METLWGYIYEAISGQFPEKIASQIEISKRSVYIAPLRGLEAWATHPDPTSTTTSLHHCYKLHEVLPKRISAEMCRVTMGRARAQVRVQSAWI